MGSACLRRASSRTRANRLAIVALRQDESLAARLFGGTAPHNVAENPTPNSREKSDGSSDALDYRRLYLIKEPAMKHHALHVLMCLPMLLAAVFLLAGGAGAWSLLLPLVCVVMMGAMVAMAVRGGGGDRR